MCIISPDKQESTESSWSKIDRNRVKNVREISGHGLIATVDETEVAVGNKN